MANVPVFGKSTIGIYNASSPSANSKFACLFNLAVAANNIDALIAIYNTTNTSAKLKGLIYADDAGEPGALLHTTEEVMGVVVNDPCVLPFASRISLSAGNYWLGIIADTQLIMACDITGTNRYNDDTYADGPSDPFGTASVSSYQKTVFAAEVILTLDVSKLNYYAVLEPPDMSVSKLNYYAVLSTEITVGVSKLNYYAVLEEAPLITNKPSMMIIT